MKNIFSIFKKEFDKIFKFPRMIFSTLILPGLLIFLIYAFMGQGLQTQIDKNAEHESIIHVINIPSSFMSAVEDADQILKNINQKLNVKIISSNIDELDALKGKLNNDEIDLILVFPLDFDLNVINRLDPAITTYKSSSTNSTEANNRSLMIFDTLKSNFLIELEIDPNIFVVSQPLPVGEGGGDFNVLSMLLPILIISFIFGSALGLGSDAIAGEKERGTLATLLMAPIKRNEIIIGKIASTTIITILSATSSFIGIAASLPFAKSMFAIEGTLSYGILDYLGIFGILILLSVLASSTLLIFSTIAKNIKEATSYSMPVYIVALIIPVFSMFNMAKNQPDFLYLVPLYNCVVGLKNILEMNINVYQYLLMLGSSLVYIFLLVALLIRLFKSEKVLFSK